MPDGADRAAFRWRVTNRENLVEIEAVQVIAGGDPLPDEGSVPCADAIERAAHSAMPDDLLLVLISGGGSAPICARVWDRSRRQDRSQ
nr:DUF4147 domain-containing protein [Mesorhizobium sp.]